MWHGGGLEQRKAAAVLFEPLKGRAKADLSDMHGLIDELITQTGGTPRPRRQFNGRSSPANQR